MIVTGSILIINDSFGLNTASIVTWLNIMTLTSCNFHFISVRRAFSSSFFSYSLELTSARPVFMNEEAKGRHLSFRTTHSDATIFSFEPYVSIKKDEIYSRFPFILLFFSPHLSFVSSDDQQGGKNSCMRIMREDDVRCGSQVCYASEDKRNRSPFYYFSVLFEKYT